MVVLRDGPIIYDRGSKREKAHGEVFRAVQWPRSMLPLRRRLWRANTPARRLPLEYPSFDLVGGTVSLSLLYGDADERPAVGLSLCHDAASARNLLYSPHVTSHKPVQSASLGCRTQL